MLKFQLIPEWRSAWRFLSVKAAALLVVISAVREFAQQNVDTMPSLAFIAHAPWYAPTMAILGTAVALLRLIHQPVVAPATEVASMDVPSTPPAVLLPLVQGLTMNQNFTSLFNFALRLVIGVQQLSVAQPTALTGPDKKAAAIAIAQASVDPTDTSTVGQIINMIDPIVSLLNVTGHALFAKSAAPVASQTAEPVA